MSKEELFEKFEQMFPEWAPKVTSYKKIGSKCLAVRFGYDSKGHDISRVFLYGGPNDWHFGTKLWRKRPEHLEKIHLKVGFYD